jgi:hypothetical protein
LRPGHKSSSGLEKGFEPDSEVETVLEAIEQCHLVDKDGSQGKALGVAQALGRDRTVHPEDPLEVLVEVFDRHRAQLVEDAPDFDAAIGVGIGPAAGGYQDPVGPVTQPAEVGIVVVDIAQEMADLGGQLTDQVGSSRTLA